MRVRYWITRGAGVASLLIAAGAVAVDAQNGRSYGPGHIWWEPGQRDVLPWTEEYDNATGRLAVFNKGGAVNAEGHPFFEPLGKNGRACITCHQPANAMSLTAALARERWGDTNGKDPLFAAIDGSNCPDLPQADAKSHSLLLGRGLIRIALPWPPQDADGTAIHPEFHIEVVSDPSGCNTSARYGLQSARGAISVFRRPRMTANLPLLVPGPTGAALMADGREPTLRSQAITAALVHEEAPVTPTEEQLRRILAFETQIFVTQGSDFRGGLTYEAYGPALLGAENLANGRTSSLGMDYRDQILQSLRPWSALDPEHQGLQYQFRASVVRGGNLFFDRKLSTSGDSAAVTCASCHAGGSKRWVNIGSTSETADTRELPTFKITCTATGAVTLTHDPGRASITGKCEDVGAIVVPQFRALSSRAPYFSNGMAATLPDVVEFYSRRFAANFSSEEKQDLINFLSVL